MKTIIKKELLLLTGIKNRELIIDILVYLFILLFVYTATSKIYGFRDFNSVLYSIPLFGSAHFILAVLIISLQLVIGLLLIIPSTKSFGLYATLILLIIFTVYLIYMVSFAATLPCSCAGLSPNLTWENQIWLNIILIVLAGFGILTNQYKKQQL